MPQTELQTSQIESQHEDARLAALAATGILDTAPEPSFDAITRLAAEYFKADTVLLEFADESRLWIKSHWGEPVRELPRCSSAFEMVLAANGPSRHVIESSGFQYQRSLSQRRVLGRVTR